MKILNSVDNVDIIVLQLQYFKSTHAEELYSQSQSSNLLGSKQLCSCLTDTAERYYTIRNLRMGSRVLTAWYVC